MGVDTVEEMGKNRSGQVDENGLTLQRVFKVTTTAVTDTAKDVLLDPSVPQRGTQLPGTPELIVDSTTAKLIDGKNHFKLWQVVAKYKPIDGPVVGAPGGGVIRPWDLPPVVDYFFQSREKVFEKAYQKDPVGGPLAPISGAVRNQPTEKVQNSVEMPFDPPVMIQESLLGISIRRAVEGGAFNPNDLVKYVNTVNNKAVPVGGITIPVFQGYIRDYKATKAFTEDNLPYFNTTIEILTDPQTFLKRIVDQGFYIGDSSGGPSEPVVYTQIQDTDGDRVDDPVPLDGNGQQLGAGLPLVTLDYHGYWEEDFNALNLPPNK